MVKGVQVKCLLFVVSLISIGNAKAQYCTTSYTSSQCNNYNMYIDDVKTTGGKTNITNMNTKCGNSSTSYKYYSNHVHEGVQGTQVGISVTIGATYNQGVRVWVDFNRDGDFTDAGENVLTKLTSNNTSATGTFTIPANADPGETRMRIRSVYSTTSFNSCGSANYGEVEDYKFVILPSCPVEFTGNPKDVKDCATLSAKYSVNVKDADSLRWQYDAGNGFINIENDGTFSDATTTTLTVNNIAAYMIGYKFRCVGFNINETCAVSSKTADLDVIPLGQSSVNIHATDTNICEGDQVAIQCYYTNGGTTPAFQWKINGIDTPGQVMASYVATDINDGDTLELVFNSSEQCVLPKSSNKIVFHVDDVETPTVDIDVSYQGNNQYTFTAVPEYGGANPYYQWFRNEIMVAAGENVSTYSANDLKSTDRIHVELISDRECVDVKRVNSMVHSTGMANVAISGNSLNIHPNPTNGNFYITGDIAGQEDISIKVINTIGKLVHQQVVSAQSGNISIPVNLPANLSTGVYSANITFGEQVSNIRFILNR